MTDYIEKLRKDLDAFHNRLERKEPVDLNTIVDAAQKLLSLIESEELAVVPIETTEHMEIQGAISAEYEKQKPSRKRAYDCYKAMLTAAPKDWIERLG